MRTEIRQRGLASTEAILVLPLLLLLFILALHAAQILLLKQENQTAARTLAWRQALFGSLCFIPPRDSHDGTLLGATCAGDKQSESFAGRYLGALGQGGSYTGQLSGEIRKTGVPERVRVTARALYKAGREQPLDWFLLADQHSLEPLSPGWTRKELPIGYDAYLKGVLNSRTLFPDYFPKAP